MSLRWLAFRLRRLAFRLRQLAFRSACGKIVSVNAPLATNETTPADVLSSVLCVDDPRDALWELVDSGWADEHFPEMVALRMPQHPVYRHKEVLAHTIVVTAQAPPRLRVRLAALFHDIGKPNTRKFEHGDVTFTHHEAVGSHITAGRMEKLGYPAQLTEQVARLVFLSGRFKGYADGWSDTAVRRYARDAGELLGDLNDLVRADITTRNQRKVWELHLAVDELEERVAQLAREAAVAAERPELDGDAVMAHLGIGPGPAVGAALKFLLEIKRSEGELGVDEAKRRLDEWWAQREAR